MAPSVDITIPTTSTSSTSKPYTIYNITLRQPLRSFILSKRYSDFQALHASLTSQSSNTSPPAPLPQKTWFKSSVTTPSLAETRRAGLQAYLQAINTSPDPRWRNTAAWRAFLNLPRNADTPTASSSSASALRTADLQTRITDPSVWLDTHRDLKTALRDAKQHLARRDQAPTAQTQHEATSDARRSLVKAGTVIAALENGLQDMSSGLGEGEVRRRRDLLSAARKERDAMDATLATFVQRNPASDAAQATAGDLATLLQTAPASASRGRVLGAQPLRETERTRELDNQGVAQLQRQIMAEQDEDVTDLMAVVRRMKMMGVQINEELVSQNELLGMLDQDVGRVGDKIDVAKKRLGKIK